MNDNYKEGGTSFYTTNFEHIRTIKPEAGKALIFDIDLWHKGDSVINGEKYWIGCEIIGKFN